MTLKIKHQVFLSSTFKDLKDERAEIIQAISELDCIPATMEAFVATSEDQWTTILDVIADCDYYVLIVAGRYGSVTADGLSYTEKEYRHAKELGLPILAFVHDDIEGLPAKNVDSEAASKEALARFRAQVMAERLVKTWKTADQLSGYVSRSLAKAIKNTPRPGWVRNEGGTAADYVARLGDLVQENESLRKEIEKLKGMQRSPDKNLLQGSDKHNLSGYLSGVLRSTGKEEREDRVWETTWRDLFIYLGPLLANEATEAELRGRVIEVIKLKDQPNKNDNALKWRAVTHGIYANRFDEILNQLRALGYVERGSKRRAISDKEKYWKLTTLGDQTLVDSMALRSKP